VPKEQPRWIVVRSWFENSGSCSRVIAFLSKDLKIFKSKVEKYLGFFKIFRPEAVKIINLITKRV
jgi:hypothetical protein